MGRASNRWEDPPRGRGTVADAGHPLDAMNAERSLGAPLAGRSTWVVEVTTELTVAKGDDDHAAVGKPEPSANRGAAPAAPTFRWNSCRFIATRFQLGLRTPPTRDS